MRVRVLTCSAAVVFSVLVVAPVAADDPVDPAGGAPGARAIWLIDDFEDGLEPGWTDPVGGGNSSIDTIGANGTAHSLRIDGGTGAWDMWYDMGGGYQPAGVTTYIRSASTSALDAYFVLGDDNTTSNNGIIFFLASNTGELVAITDDYWYSAGPYSANTWYRIDFTLDWACVAFDVYVDGALKLWNLPFRNADVTEITQIQVLNFNSSTAWWDQISMTWPPPGNLLFSDDFERGSTCRWSQTVP